MKVDATAATGLDARASGSSLLATEQFQEKCEAVFRPGLRRNKELEQIAVSLKR
ncbi:hypothetical protein [Mesorhizobium comanense]|jgi:hypothetical protein|uniref:hypothetical protein n=1 Tax=Mesorhizobium comanense TaxID=2502215 RepID=UPI001485953E|nr:hypothetical protein [Mesorhizobium comanense]